MKTKVCLKCKKEKPLNAEFFHRNKSRKSGFQDHCKECRAEIRKEYCQRPEVKERRKEYMKEWGREYYQRPEVKERAKEYMKEYNQRPEVKEKRKEYNQRPEVKEKKKEYRKKYRQRPEVKEKKKEYRKKYNQRPEVKERKREWRKEYDKEYNRKPEVKERKKEYMKEKYKNNLEYRLSSCVRGSLSRSLKKFKLKKENKTFEILDFTLFDLINHLESQFDEDMNWDNYGSYWHLDHIRPVSSFSFKSTDCPEFKKCWSLSNLQPLEASENLSKNSYFEGVKHTYKKEKA